ncbi:DUF5677 domain-containing protein [Stenotrophomonas maltophilia]|uniref:DUF5677 domain-containing protein n=1 Tax=Stenotrophomonas maltophilia TaxID=40324 RepID=UPI000DA2F213|nr:DUF5677 domain-containing protein [Stenotrophomonas maltophilia]SQG08617.1 Uncharacterised protein [Stenotrophomonas maltophilia]
MVDVCEALDQLTNECRQHLADLPQLQSCLARLERSIGRMEDRASIPRYTIKTVHAQTSLRAIVEGLTTAFEAIAARRYSAAEALCRVVFEQTVNLMFVLHDNDASRAKSLLAFHLEDARRRATQWHRAAERANNSSAQNAARMKLEHIERLKTSTETLSSASLRPWPNARDRFSSLGLELHYYELFASASDSIHSLSEDFFSAVMIECGPDILRRERRIASDFERGSFSIYLGAQGLQLFANAFLHLSSELKDPASQEQAQTALEMVQEIVSKHESDHAGHWNQLRSPPEDS